ncbi:hypothetical protein ACCO45_011456 [Purpureocillium lilacinum]|uniref:Uncharacterized protein n=1 Tax=Purpureocillium lilacinum TaxID=33203 RepID=A0ACC4DAW1_PURLI
MTPIGADARIHPPPAAAAAAAAAGRLELAARSSRQQLDHRPPFVSWSSSGHPKHPVSTSIQTIRSGPPPPRRAPQRACYLSLLGIGPGPSSFTTPAAGGSPCGALLALHIEEGFGGSRAWSLLAVPQKRRAISTRRPVIIATLPASSSVSHRRQSTAPASSPPLLLRLSSALAAPLRPPDPFLAAVCPCSARPGRLASRRNPQSALSSTTGLSSNEHFVDAQQHQLSQQQQHPTASSLSSSSQPQPQPQHPHFYGQQSAGVRLPPLQTSSDVALGGSPVFDARHQHPATPIDFADAAAVSRSQSQRFDPSVHHLTQQHQQQHPQVYGIASGSIDDLPGTASYQPSPIATNAPEKRSTRKLFKGIFGSGRSSHDPAPQQQHGHAHQVSYDNTAGLARRPSKRVSNPPIKTGSLPPATQQQQPPSGSDRDWYQGPPSQQPSPLHDLGEVDEYPYSAQESNAHIPPQDSRLVYPSTTIRQVSREHLDTSPYDEELYQAPDHLPHQLQQHHQQLQHQPQPLQRQGTLHGQDQQILYEPQQQQSQQQQPPPPPQQQTATYDLQPPPSHQQQQFHHGGNSPQAPYQPGQEPRIVTSHFGLQQNPETISQLSHESPVTDPDQRSATQQQPVPVDPEIASHPGDQQPGSDPAAIRNGSPRRASAPSRRLDNDKALRGQVEPPPGPPPGYRQGGVPMNSMSPLPPPHGQGGPQNPAYRSDRASQYEGSGVVEQGRNSPQPSNPDRDVDPDKQFKDLLTKYKNVKRLYFDGKSQIEQLTSQVETLQNAVANQRMSASRTAWDDNEYTTRFNRLNGAINNLAFNIRKDWRSLPQWLEGYVSADALKTGKQEMTAVGRAIVSRWLVEEIFNKCFHPALDPQLSSQLKEIELSIRGNAYTMHSQEEFDALTTKVVNWRMATLDGLQKKFNSTTTDNRTMFTSKATSDLTTHLYQHLTSPPPAGVEGTATWPSCTLYPGETVQPHLMEVEKTGLPALENQKSEVDAGGDDDDDEPDKDKDKNGRVRGDKAKAGMLTSGSMNALEAGRKGSNASFAERMSTDRDTRAGLPNDAGKVDKEVCIFELARCHDDKRVEAIPGSFKWVDVVGLELAMGLHHDGWDDGGSERRGASHCGTWQRAKTGVMVMVRALSHTSDAAQLPVPAGVGAASHRRIRFLALRGTTAKETRGEAQGISASCKISNPGGDVTRLLPRRSWKEAMVVVVDGSGSSAARETLPLTKQDSSPTPATDCGPSCPPTTVLSSAGLQHRVLATAPWGGQYLLPTTPWRP